MKELIEIQNKLKAPKGQYNSFGKYRYRSCEDILEAVKPLLYEHKCQLTISDEMESVGNRIYVKSTVTFVNEAGDSVTTTGYAREEETKKGMDGSQVTGASSSYARKYALNGMFCIDDTKDSDATNTHGKSQQSDNSSALKEIANAKNLQEIVNIYNNHGELHEDKQFMSALSEKKKQFKS